MTRRAVSGPDGARGAGPGLDPGRRAGFGAGPGRRAGFGLDPGRRAGFGPGPGRRAGGVDPGRRARLGDAGCFLAALVVGGMATDAAGPLPAVADDVNTLVGLAAAAALWWRRRAPLVVAAVTFAASAAAPLAAGAAIMSVFTVAACRPQRIAIAVAALYLAPAAIGRVVVGDGASGLGQSALGAIVFTLAALGWGIAVRSRRATMTALAERAERAEAEQQARVAEARRAERARIAVEMHDVLAHRLSMLSLHAGAIELRPDAPPERLADAAAVVRDNAHRALEELRAVVGVLRDEDGAPSGDDGWLRDQDGGLAPAPTLADLDALLAESRAAGMDLDVAEVAAGLDTLPPTVGRHAYRIVQEGLTNARKHAPDRPVRLAVGGDRGAGLTIEVANPTVAASARHRPGMGLVGLRERVAAVGGELRTGVDADGMHRLHARLPWPP